MGSDCLYIYLVIMPEVKKNIVVHAHDIYLPFGFPRNKSLEIQVYWTEQYLLYAYMLDNPKISVLFGSKYARRFLEEPLKKFMGGKYPYNKGASIWYELKGAVD